MTAPIPNGYMLTQLRDYGGDEATVRQTIANVLRDSAAIVMTKQERNGETIFHGAIYIVAPDNVGIPPLVSEEMLAEMAEWKRQRDIKHAARAQPAATGG